MRKCPTEQQLAEYADQQSIGADRHVIELHLVGCDRCLRQVGFLVRNSGAERPKVPAELLERAKRLRGRKRRWLVFPWSWATVATGDWLGFERQMDAAHSNWTLGRFSLIATGALRISRFPAGSIQRQLVLLQLYVLRFGLLQDGYVGVSVFPESEKSLVETT